MGLNGGGIIFDYYPMIAASDMQSNLFKWTFVDKKQADIYYA
jgi:hypothetical protein